ncbi:hypothetical protein LSAT2_026223 [Lamellibrachia satsuma]|nr:hypothetical protein LSAT2_026223 [Lamellibrachia satsuma]
MFTRDVNDDDMNNLGGPLDDLRYQRIVVRERETEANYVGLTPNARGFVDLSISVTVSATVLQFFKCVYDWCGSPVTAVVDPVIRLSPPTTLLQDLEFVYS